MTLENASQHETSGGVTPGTGVINGIGTDANQTGGDAQTAAQTVTPAASPATSETGAADTDTKALEDKLNMWRTMSRDNERKMKENLTRATTAEKALSEANMTIARLRAQSAHPQLTDTIIDELAPKNTTPAEFTAWADRAAAYIPSPQAGAPANGTPDANTAPRDTSREFMEADLKLLPQPHGNTAGTAESGYAYGKRRMAIPSDGSRKH